MVGTTLAGCYEIMSVIGHGGMGVVYKARHQLMDRIVAIKMMKSQLISDTISVKRFQQEVKAYAKINHPHVITVFDFGVSPDGLPYIVMDYLEGHPLSDVIKKDGSVGVERAIRVLTQACEALAHAHKQGIVHRDLKPGNIVLIEYDGDPDFVKVVDFGVAKLMNAQEQRLTQTGEVCGSPVYMSPEQCLGQEMDLRSDIYSMGIVIYETVTGKLPLIGRTMVDTMAKQVSEMPPPFAKIRPDIYIPERLQSVVFKAMSKEPAQRHQTMDELREDLEKAIPKPARPSTLRQVEPFKAAEEVVSSGISRTSLILGAVVSFSMLAGGLTLYTMLEKNFDPGRHPTAVASPEQKVDPAKTATAIPNKIDSEHVQGKGESGNKNPGRGENRGSEEGASKESAEGKSGKTSPEAKGSAAHESGQKEVSTEPDGETNKGHSAAAKTVAAFTPARKPTTAVTTPAKRAALLRAKGGSTVTSARKKPVEKKPAAAKGKDVWQSLRNELPR